MKPDAPLQAIELSALGAKVGANLTPENVALPGLRFTTAFMLTYEGSPLGVIAYVDPSGAPVVLCIIANHAPDAPMRSERRGDLSLAWWSRGGREPSGDWPHPGGAGSCISANARKANLTSAVACGARGMAGRMSA